MADSKERESPAQIVTTAAKRWLELGDDLFPAAVLVATVANRLSGPPVWVMFVAPPSSGKSQLLMALNGIKGVRPLSKITNKTLVSGMVDDGNKKKALLEEMTRRGEWLMVLKDFGTLDNLPSEVRNEILGQLREVYDGQIAAAYGTGKEINWEGKLGILAGATPAVDGRRKWSTELGERFVQYRPTSADPARVAEKAQRHALEQDEIAEDLRAAYASAFDLAVPVERSAAAAEQVGSAAIVLAEFISGARRPVDRSQPGSSYFQVGVAEGPGRLTKVFTILGEASLACFDGDVEAATVLLVRFALSSITPGNRGALLQLLASHPDGVTVEQARTELMCDDNTARRVLEDLAHIDLATKSRPGKTDVFYASERLAHYAQRIFVHAPSSEAALAKLTLLPTNLPQEGQEEEEEG